MDYSTYTQKLDGIRLEVRAPTATSSIYRSCYSTILNNIQRFVPWTGRMRPWAAASDRRISHLFFQLSVRSFLSALENGTGGACSPIAAVHLFAKSWSLI